MGERERGRESEREREREDEISSRKDLSPRGARDTDRLDEKTAT